jgi:hypothetical protein
MSKDCTREFSNSFVEEEKRMTDERERERERKRERDELFC